MSTALAQRQDSNIIQMPTMPTIELLDPYSPTGVMEAAQDSLDCIATISAGKKVQRGDKEFPQASRDGVICLHDEDNRAPGLAFALKQTGYKSLTIAFPWNDPSKFVRQSFTEYSASSLLTFGDKNSLTVIENGKRVTHQVGTREYETAKARCKVSTFVYFYLAEWGEDGPELVFPDGFGFYRLRFTSQNSARSLKSSIEYITDRTGGRIAGLPLQLSISYRDTFDKTQKRQRIAVWNFLLKPPGGIRLTPKIWQEIAPAALAQGEMLQLPAPTDEQVMTALEAGPDADLDDIPEAEITEVEAEQIARGGTCDVAHYRKKWFATVKDTYLDSDAARRFYIAEYTSGAMVSLSELLATFNDEDASDFLTGVSMDVQCDDWTRYEWHARFLNDAGVLRKDGQEWPHFKGKPRPEVLEKALTHIGAAMEAMQNPQPQTLQQAVRAKGEAAKVDSDPEGSELFNRPDEPETVAETATEEPPANIDMDTGEIIEGEVSAPEPVKLSAMLQSLVAESVRQNLPVDEATMRGPATEAINAFLVANKRQPVADIFAIKSGVAGFILPAIVNGSIKWEAAQ